MTAQPTTEDHGGCRGMPKDAQDGQSESNIIAVKYRRVIYLRIVN